MKEKYVTITGTNYYYGMKPFSVGKKVKCLRNQTMPLIQKQLKLS